jgi:hypothetical protein
MIWPALIFGQAGFDLTGRASLRIQTTAYDENSAILPDSIPDDQYAKTTLIPGLQQTLNLSLFGRTENLDATFLADLKNNDWNTLQLSNLNSISRLTLALKWANQELIAGDFFDSHNELFIFSREIRGGRYYLKVPHVWTPHSFIEVWTMGGEIQQAIDEGSRSEGLYKQYENAGQYRRLMGAGILKMGLSNTFDLTVNYLYGKDKEASIDTSLSLPLQNKVYGGAVNFYLWDRKIRLFAEYNRSVKDTLKVSQVPDEAYFAGLGFRHATLNLIFAYESLGTDYFTMGYPYLENDKRGYKGQLDYAFPRILQFTTEMEIYDDNLNEKTDLPTASTTILNAGLTTLFAGWPEIGLRYGIRSDLSATIYDQDDQPFKTDKMSTKIEGRLAFNLDRNRFSLSFINLDLEDKSQIGSTLPLSTKQSIGSLNFYSSAVTNLFLSSGVVYSYLELSNDQTNDNLYLYGTTRWNIIPRLLLLESSLTLIKNEARNGGTQDLLNDYSALLAEVSLEYFVSSQFSFKLILGTDDKNYRYSTEDALDVVSDPNYGPAYFNGYESYNALIAGGEINWIF